MRRIILGVVVLLAVAGCATPAPAPDARIVVDDTDVLADEPVTVSVAGLSPGSEVTLWARRVDDLGRPWLAYQRFTADGAGAVDVGEPMRLFTAMRLADGAAAAPPFPVGADATVTLTAQVGGATVAQAEVLRRGATPGVVEREIREDGLVGVLFSPPGPGPHPGVILLGGSEGGVPDYGAAELLASRGFTTLALAYFGVDGLPVELVRIPLEYFEGAMDWLSAQPGVGTDRVGVLGASRGGELALLLGSTFPQVGAVVSYVGSGLGYAGLPQSGFSATPPAAWTLDGRDVPFVLPVFGADAWARYLPPTVLGLPYTDVAGTWPGILAAGPDAMATAEIPVERIDGPVLLLSGADDRLWPSPQMSDVALDRLAGSPHRHQHVSFPGTGHFFFGAPYGGPFLTELNAGYGLTAFGGTEPGNAAAAAAAWPLVLQTLRDGLENR